MALGMEVGSGDFVLAGDPARLLKKGAEPPPPFSAHVYCGQTAGWIKMALGMEVGVGPDHIVLDGDPAPLRKKGTEPPIFGPSLFWPNGCMHLKMPVGMHNGGRPQPSDFVLDGGPVRLRKKGRAVPQFSAHVYCGQTAACIKMPLGTEVGLGLCDIVLDGDPSPLSPKGAQLPNFRPMSAVAKRLDGLRCHLVWT